MPKTTKLLTNFVKYIGAKKHGVKIKYERTPAGGIPGMAAGSVFRSSVLRPLCRIRNTDRFVRAMSKDSIHHSILHSGRVFECPT